MHPITASVMLGLTAAAANAFGGAIIVQRSWERRYLRYFVALEALRHPKSTPPKSSLSANC